MRERPVTGWSVREIMGCVMIALGVASLSVSLFDWMPETVAPRETGFLFGLICALLGIMVVLIGLWKEKNNVQW